MEFVYWLFVLAVIVCGLIDYKIYIIPNVITYPLIITGIGYQIYLQSWLNIVVALAIGVSILLIGVITNGVGGGDVKLLTAMAVWIDPAQILYIIILASAVGIVWGFIKKIRVHGYMSVVDEYYKKIMLTGIVGLKGLIGLERKDKIDYRCDVVPFGTCLALALAAHHMYVYYIIRIGG